ncbi:uncharacterized protein LOC131858538 [Cryptomeria japonica]|uniref:uncharacterized protein LOC131858538 n=1 Tax=Cryptomeria japonica TaxID=3369 RepID=UPI0027D9EB6A|nr:uncharacterized protein LOC131858538 [Cryptomeria japonica]
MVQEKFWRPKLSAEAAKVLEVNPNVEASRVMTVELSTDAWKDSLSFLFDKALFVKWGGLWLTFSKFRNWCDKNWGEGMDLKTLGNGYYQVVCPTAQDRVWILENGPFFLEGKGLNILVWKPNFNPCEALVEKTLIRIKLPGLPQEYKDLETLKQIGDNLGEFVMSEELVDPSDFSLVSRLCINWQPIHNLPDKLKIKKGMGIWKQKVILEEDMESCAKCTIKIHPTGFCQKENKGKDVMRHHLEKEIIRMSEGYHGECLWNEKDWEIQSLTKYIGNFAEIIQMDKYDSQKNVIDESFVSEAHSFYLYNREIGLRNTRAY